MSRRKKRCRRCPSCGSEKKGTSGIILCECGLRYMFWSEGINAVGRTDKTWNFVPEATLPVMTEEIVM